MSAVAVGALAGLATAAKAQTTTTLDEIPVEGRAGRVGADGALTIPDYAGNRYFNTLGNIRANPRAGLLVPDFATGDLLQVSGAAEIVLDAGPVADSPGAERRPAALPLRLRDAP